MSEHKVLLEKVAWIIVVCFVGYLGHVTGGWYVKAVAYDAMSNEMKWGLTE